MRRKDDCRPELLAFVEACVNVRLTRAASRSSPPHDPVLHHGDDHGGQFRDILVRSTLVNAARSTAKTR